MKYNYKLHFAMFMTFLTQGAYAIQINPIQVQSTLGELLYAEISYQHADNTPIEVSFAHTDAVNTLAAPMSSTLNIYTRQDQNGQGVITITSSQPMQVAELDFLLQIKQGNNIRLQHIKQSLAHEKHNINEQALLPIIIKEQDFNLDLASSMPYNTAHQHTAQNSDPITALDQPPWSQNLANPAMMTSTTLAPSSTTAKAKTTTKTRHKTKQSAQHWVQKNESLWHIASTIARAKQHNIQQVMSDIQQQNPHAFIAGDANRLKQGVRLKIDYPHRPVATTKQQKSSSKAHAAKKLTTQHNAPYLRQAKMRIVSDQKDQNPTHHATSSQQDHKKIKALSEKIISSRSKAAASQKQLIHLETALNQKDHRIQLLNSKLAQLQQQLKKKNQH